MKPLIVANWKCNPTTLKESKQLFDSVKKEIKSTKGVEVVICPPFVYLPLLISSASTRQMASFGGLFFGSQNCFFEEKGAFTGEISVLMLKDLKVDYVILGHSERRRIFGETNEQINKKIKKALQAGLKPIFCVGENEEENKKGEKSGVLESQIKEGLKGVSRDESKKITIAYEPVWAIGTGKNCSINETMTSALFIKKLISEIFGKGAGENIRILYGGSVNGENAAGYVKEARTNGLLVGGASLKAAEFIKIIKSVA